MRLEFRFEFHRRAFEAVFEAGIDGGITAVFGPSGAGKTTLLHLLCGLLRPTSGFLRIDEEVVVDTQTGVNLPAHRRNIGMVFQDLRLFPHMDVRRNLVYGSRPANVDLLEDVVKLLGLRAHLEAPPFELSGGEQQRVALGRALLSRPRLLLLDEPFAAVDAELRLHILPYLRAVQARWDMPMLVVSHDLPDLLRLTDRLLLVDRGRIPAHGTLPELLRQGALLKQVRGHDLLNRFPVRFVAETSGGAARLQSTGEARQDGVELVGPAVPARYRGQTFFATIAPTEVILARDEVENVSMRNQLAGTVLDIVEHGDEVLCVVDAGVQVLAEVTPASRARLGLEKGASVHCLFKAHSLRYSR